jgi:hypothetical protein
VSVFLYVATLVTGRHLLRLLDVRDGRAEAYTSSAGDRGDAVDKPAGRNPAPHDGAVRNGRRLPRATGVGLDLLGRPAAMAFVGGALYIVGTIGVTIVCNVPLNNMLARLHPQSATAEDRGEEYVTRWIAWNHVRTITALAAAAALTVALHAG